MLHFLANVFSHPDPEMPGGVLFIRQGFVFAQRLEGAVCWPCQWIGGHLGFKSKLKRVLSPAPLFSSIHPLRLCLSFSQECEAADGCVRMPRASRSELPGNGPGGRPPLAAARLLRQHHQRAGRQELPAPAHAGGSRQYGSMYEGELTMMMMRSSFLQTRISVVVNGSETPGCC